MQSKYEVIGIVGEGAYGIVYKCRNKENGEYVAIKKFKETEDDIVKKTMSRELRALQTLKHDNIVEYKEAFKRKGNLYLVFEYVEKNLLEVLQDNPKGLDPNLIKKVIFQLCVAIKYLHSLNVIHRDIKPENLLIDSNYRLKLCDFGFARTIKGQKERLTDYVATRWYRAPELLTGAGTYGNEVDYWAIGCIMGELTDGDPLFPGENEIDQIRVIQKVIGKLTEEQMELISRNPEYKGNMEIIKPETLERRYMGKLSKQAISFMKGLLHPDPKQRLKGDTVFSHPYLESLASTLPQDSSSKHHNSTSVPKKLNTEEDKSQGKAVTHREKEKSKDKDKDSVTLSKKPTQPMISTTTNINIINYNNYEEKGKERSDSTPKNQLLKTITGFEEKKLGLNEKKLNNNKKDLILTSTSFNKTNIKDNLSNIFGKTNIDGNFKTFYKGEKYNYDIELNFKKNPSPDDHEERKNREKFGLTKNSFANNFYKDNEYFETKSGSNTNNNQTNYSNGPSNNHSSNSNFQNSSTNSQKYGKIKILEKKFKANNIIIEESYQPNNAGNPVNAGNPGHNNSTSQYQLGKLSPGKHESYKSSNFNQQPKQTQGYNLQLPSIGNKAFNFKKIK